MLYPIRVVHQLDRSVDRFRAFAEGERAAFRAFDGAFALLDQLGAAELQQRLGDVERPGALPSEEWEGYPGGLVIPFGVTLNDHRAAREWTLAHIAGIRTVAVDGSEIKPTKDYSLPLAAVQVAWFENPHVRGGRYLKDVSFQVIHPDELTGDQAEGFGLADQMLALRRFEAEVEHLIQRIEQISQVAPGEPRPVAFFDGSLVVSFAGATFAELGARYIAAVCRLLAASEATGIPVVGFVDTSLAKDLATMLAALGGLSPAQRVPDSRLLEPRLAWGDRTRALVCARDDVLSRYVDDRGRSYASELCFIYLKTNQFAAPARLDLPRWVLRAGLLDHVVNVVRAEVIVGNGYPYCIEAADACAVLGSLDREHFYRLVQEFAARNGIELRIVPKAASKRRRRA
jgi:hypothetical protein